MDIEIEIESGGLACDRRTIDPDGRLTVTDCVISAAQCNTYLGHEIPGYDVLGLNPDRVYDLYRDAEALKAAVPLFNGIPLLADHALVSAADPKQHLVVGSVSACRWDNGRVLGTVSVWVEDAIKGIEQNIRKDLSAGYRYEPRMTPGTSPNGERYDGRMVSIEPQHVALVNIGRVAGAAVGDSALDQRAELTRLIPHYGRLP